MITLTQFKQMNENGTNPREAFDCLMDQPRWITQHIDIADIQAVIKGGCESGAYMPAVTYYQATQTMAEHGNDVLEYIEHSFGELPQIPLGISWGGIAVFFLSYAVELWCSSHAELLDGVNWD